MRVFLRTRIIEELNEYWGSRLPPTSALTVVRENSHYYEVTMLRGKERLYAWVPIRHSDPCGICDGCAEYVPNCFKSCIKSSKYTPKKKVVKTIDTT
jgi:hypothetical protein